jgi:4-diphosphocytidyl-2-C-methyl-D-erythritol kinase
VGRALAAMGVAAEVDLHIEKRLPVQGGLGAGSANAVAALIGLERELARAGIAPLAEAERLRIAAEVGSDVPLFLIGGAVLGVGRGEQVSYLGDFPATECVVALPDVGVSTPQAFRDWDAMTLTSASQSDKLKQLNRTVAEIWRLDGSSGVFSQGEGLAGNPLLALVQTGIENDFESVVFPQQPRLRDLKLALAGSTPDTPKENQALAAGLSGSGAALFGIYASQAAAQAAIGRVQGLGSTALLTSTLPRSKVFADR